MGLMDAMLNETPPAPTPPPAAATAPSGAETPAQKRARLQAEIAEAEAAEKAEAEAAARAAEKAAADAAKPIPAPAATLLPINFVSQGPNGTLILKGLASVRYCVAAHMTLPADGIVHTGAAQLQHYGCKIGPEETERPAPAILPDDAATSNPAKAADPMTTEQVAALPEPARSHVEAKQAEAAAAQTAAPAEETKPKRGRPPKSTETVVQNATFAAPRPSLEVYADCVPPEASESLEGYVAGIMADMATKAGLPDIRLAPDGHGLAFGKWKAALEAKVAKEPPPPGLYVLVVGSCEARAAVSRGLAKVARVVRGVRAA